MQPRRAARVEGDPHGDLGQLTVAAGGALADHELDLLEPGAGRGRPDPVHQRFSSSGVKSVAGQTYIMIRLVSNRLFCGRCAWMLRIASRQAPSTFSSSGSATSLPSASRSGVRSRTCPIANSRSSAGLLFATALNR